MRLFARGRPSACLWSTCIAREMGGAPRNPAPRSHFLVWIVTPSSCHCTDRHLTSILSAENRQISQSADPP